MISQTTSPEGTDLFFRSVIQDYVHHEWIVKRNWLAREVETRLQVPDCRFLLLTAEPGFGKSTFLAQMALEHLDWLTYFIRRDQRTPLGDSGAHSFLLQIGFQLAVNFPHLFDSEQVRIAVEQRIEKLDSTGEVVGVELGKIYASPFHQRVLQIHQNIQEQKGKVTGVRIGEWYADNRSLPLNNLQYMALIDPATSLQRIDPQKQIVILVDALDELRYRDTDQTLLSWLSQCPSLPPNVRFILTSRPDNTLLHDFRSSQQPWLQEIAIYADNPKIQEDISSYISSWMLEQRVQETLRFMGKHEHEFVRQAVEKANGNFGYAGAVGRTIEHAIEREDQQELNAALDLSKLPPTLPGLYAFFLRRIKDSIARDSVEIQSITAKRQPIYLPAWDALYRPILGSLSIAAEPLSIRQIAFFGRTPAAIPWVQSALDRLKQFLNQGSDGYQFFHSSVMEFLTGVDTASLYPDLYMNPAEWHAGIVAYYQGEALSWSESAWSGDTSPDDYGWCWLIHHMIGADDTNGLQQCFRTGFLKQKEILGYSPDRLQADFTSALSFFSQRGDLSSMVLIASSFQRLTGTTDLFKYESFPVWLGLLAASANDESQIKRMMVYIEGQPPGEDRIRMISEFLIGIGEHQLAGDFRETHRIELEKLVRDAPEKSGLDLLAAEALGDVDQAFHLAKLYNQQPSAQRICRIIKLVQRHSNHPRAASLLVYLLERENDRSYPASRTFDAILASFGLLWNSSERIPALENAIRIFLRGGVNPDGISALFIAVYLIDQPETLYSLLDFAVRGRGSSELLTRALLYMGWFDPELEHQDLVHSVLHVRARESAGKIKTPNGRALQFPGNFPIWRSRILAAHLDDFWLTQGTQNCRAHEAILSPVFLLWAKLVHDSDTLDKIVDLDLSALSPAYESFFSRDSHEFIEWIELGQALCCVGRITLSQKLLERFNALINKKNATAHSVYDRNSFGSFLRNSLILGVVWCEGAVLGIAIALLSVLLIRILYLLLVVITLRWQISTYWNWLRRNPASQHIIQVFSNKQGKTRNLAWWLEGTNIWQFVVINFLEGGREDLAIRAIPAVLEPQHFIHQLQPRWWRRQSHLNALRRLGRSFLESIKSSDGEDWQTLLEELVDLWQAKVSFCFSAAGVRLVMKGCLTMEGLILITRRFTPGKSISLDKPHEMDLLIEAIDSIEDDRDFLSACRALKNIRVSDHVCPRLVSSVLQSALLRSKNTFAETT
ncbi:MAG: hypothetical protein C4583_11350 [Anaerolineaceae bacterium]|jgi:hypothetical protein|nr:MAG: hypothetical protein C4583_11350 [Anaerolineaceae bacterium]